MNHHASRRFWSLYEALPAEIRDLADKNFQLMKSNPQHPSLRFKKIGDRFSVRIGLHHRALGVSVEDGVLWFWIGTHGDYDKLVS